MDRVLWIAYFGSINVDRVLRTIIMTVHRLLWIAYFGSCFGYGSWILDRIGITSNYKLGLGMGLRQGRNLDGRSASVG